MLCFDHKYNKYTSFLRQTKWVCERCGKKVGEEGHTIWQLKKDSLDRAIARMINIR